MRRRGLAAICRGMVGSSSYSGLHDDGKSRWFDSNTLHQRGGRANERIPSVERQAKLRDVRFAVNLKPFMQM